MKTTEYTYRATICTPLELVEQTNHLACIVGESPSDIYTFNAPTHTKDGKEWCCISTVVKPIVVMLAELRQLPPNLPEHAIGVADPIEAKKALDSMNKEGGIVVDFVNLLSEEGKVVEIESVASIYSRLGFSSIQDDYGEEIEERH